MVQVSIPHWYDWNLKCYENRSGHPHNLLVSDTIEILKKLVAIQSEFLEYKQTDLETQIEKVDWFRTDFNPTKKRLKEATLKLKQIKELAFENWKASHSQLTIEFE